MGYEKLETGLALHRETKLSSKSENKEEFWWILRVCYHVLIGLLLLSMIIICTIYISHLQTHVQELDGQIRFLGRERHANTEAAIKLQTNGDQTQPAPSVTEQMQVDVARPGWNVGNRALGGGRSKPL